MVARIAADVLIGSGANTFVAWVATCGTANGLLLLR